QISTRTRLASKDVLSPSITGRDMKRDVSFKAFPFKNIALLRRGGN
ncbi:1279_t:CDS:1, partial [Acaulospora colombiana]